MSEVKQETWYRGEQEPGSDIFIWTDEHKTRLVGSVSCEDCTPEEQLRRADLIAASLDLVAACQAVFDSAEESEEYYVIEEEAFKKVEVALSRLKGGAK